MPIKTIIHPAAGRIVIREIRGSDKTPAGIILIADVRRDAHLGEVVAVCDGWRDEAGKEYDSDFKVGDIVAFGKYTGTEIAIERDKYIILMEKDIMCVLEEQDSEVNRCASCRFPLSAPPSIDCIYPLAHK